MLRGRHCSYVTVHRNETYLYFNDLRGDAERPGRRPPYTKRAEDRAASARCRCRRTRVRVSSCSWSKPLDRTVLELLVRLRGAEIQRRCTIKVDRSPTAGTAPTSFR